MRDCGPAKGGKEKKKGPECPYMPLLGFFLFCSEFHPRIKSTNPGISTGDVAKNLGETWSNLHNSKRQSCITKAAKLRRSTTRTLPTVNLKPSSMVQRLLPKLPGKRWDRKTQRTRRMNKNLFCLPVTPLE